MALLRYLKALKDGLFDPRGFLANEVATFQIDLSPDHKYYEKYYKQLSYHPVNICISVMVNLVLMVRKMFDTWD